MTGCVARSFVSGGAMRHAHARSSTSVDAGMRLAAFSGAMINLRRLPRVEFVVARAAHPLVWGLMGAGLLAGCAGAVVKPSDPYRPQPHGEEAADTFVENQVEVVGSPPPTSRYEPLATYDTSGDGVVDEDELRAFSDSLFARLDQNDDQQLGRDELAQSPGPDGPYRRWDGDGDGMISKQEFVSGRWKTYDADRDSSVDPSELQDSQGWEDRYGVGAPAGGHPGY